MDGTLKRILTEHPRPNTGRGDYITFSDEGFSAAREFTISFWFSRRTECTKPGRYEFLYSEARDDGLPFWRTVRALWGG